MQLHGKQSNLNMFFIIIFINKERLYMQTLLMWVFIFIALPQSISAGKDEMLASKVAKVVKSKKNNEVKIFKVSDFVSSTSSSSSSSSSARQSSAIPFKESSSGYYNPQRKSKLYDASSSELCLLSRSGMASYLACPICFYLNRKKGLNTPPGFPFSLNNAVDELQKKSFDKHRLAQTVHPLCAENGLNLVPFQHPEIDAWRNSLSGGLKVAMPETNIVLQGGIDDIWIDLETKELFIVDYKATSKKGEVSLDAAWQDSYKRQVETYQALLRGVLQDTEYTVSDTAYFVYSNGRADVAEFNDELKFKTTLIPYKGNADWVYPTVIAAYQCLQSDTIPSDSRAKEISEKYCDLCRYVKLRNSLEKAD